MHKVAILLFFFCATRGAAGNQVGVDVSVAAKQCCEIRGNYRFQDVWMYLCLCLAHSQRKLYTSARVSFFFPRLSVRLSLRVSQI